MRNALLDGVVVVEIVGDKVELSSRLMADMGADVIKVEPPGGAASRSHPPFAEDGTSLYSAIRNTNKRSIVLDLESTEDREILWKLLEKADVLIEDQHADLVAAGFSPDEVFSRFPQLVYVSVTDFGLTGPYAHFTATDPVHLALGTQLSRSGQPGREPLVPPGYMSHEAAAFHVTWAALVAYYHRLVTGLGDHIDLSIYEATLQALDPPFGTTGTASASIKSGSAAPDVEHGRPTSNMYPIFRCVDGFVRLVILSPRQWQAMYEWLGSPAEFADPKYNTTLGRYEARATLYPLYEQLFGNRKKSEVAAEGQARGIPMSPVASIADVLRDPDFDVSGSFIDTEIADNISARVPSGYFVINGERAGIRHRSPRIGEHAEQIRAELNSDSPPPAPARLRSLETPRRPLEGLRVIDFGVYIVGSEVGRMFADMGADVIKVENRAFPDGSRAAIPAPMHPTIAAGHRNKRSLGVNLRAPEGVEVIKRLVRESDVIVSNFKPGTLDKLGLSYQVLSRINPSLVWMSGSGFGEVGPRRTWLGYGPLVRSGSGLTSLWRHPDDEESFCETTTIYPDHFAGRTSAVVVMAALVGRARTGHGSDLRVAQVDSSINHIADFFAHESLHPGSGIAPGNTSPAGAPWNVYRCRGNDEWCVINVGTEVQWEGFRIAMGNPSWTADPKFASMQDRIAHRDELDAHVTEWTARMTPDKVMDTLQRHRVPAGAMRRVSEMLDDPHFQARNCVGWLEQPGLDEPVPLETAPFRSRRVLPPDMRPAPFQGQHTAEVCAEVLDMDAGEISRLIEAGVLEPQHKDVHVV